MAKRGLYFGLGIVGATALAGGAVWLRRRSASGEGVYGDPSSAAIVQFAVTIAAAPDAVYRLWRDPEAHPRFLSQVQITPLSDTRWRWSRQSASGRRHEWETEFIEQEPGKRLSWRADRGSGRLWPGFSQLGTLSLTPAPGQRGTEVRLRLELSGVIPRLLKTRIEHGVENNLRRLKQFMETGEIATTVGQSSGRRSWVVREMQPLDRRQASPREFKVAQRPNRLSAQR